MSASGAGNEVHEAPFLPPSPLRPPRSRPPWRWVAAVVVAVLVATVGILYLEGIPPIGHPPGTHHPTGPVSFRVARQQAEGAVSGYHGGGWSLIAGGALMTQATIGLPNASLGSQLSNLVPGCPLSWLGGSQTEVIPSFSGNSSTGLSPFWGLVFRNASEGLLLVSVINGSAILSAQVAGTANCNLSLGIALIGALPSDLPDSDVIGSAAGSAGGYRFLKAHPGADASMVLVGGLSLFTFSLPSQWFVTYTLCSPLTGLAQEPEFNATINAMTGQVTSSETATQNCTALPSLGGVLPGINGPRTAPPLALNLSRSIAVGTPTESAGGSHHWYNFTVTRVNASSDPRFGNLSFLFFNFSGAVRATSSWSLLAEGSGGTHLATFDLAASSWSMGASTAIAAGDVFALDSGGTSLSGGQFVLLGTGSFSGIIDVPIP